MKSSKCYHSTGSYYTEQYYPVILFIMLYELVLTSESNKNPLKALSQSHLFFNICKIKFLAFSLNLLRPNVHIQILQTDLYIFL